MIEPSRPGISYSFTSDGFYEESYYRAISNPADPSCPGAIMQWQHGSYVIGSDGSLTMTPIAVDGRQLLSQPCQNSHAIYTRYNTTEKMKVCASSSILCFSNQHTNKNQRHTASTQTPTTVSSASTSPNSTAKSCNQCTSSITLLRCCLLRLSTPPSLPAALPLQRQSAMLAERSPQISRWAFRARS